MTDFDDTDFDGNEFLSQVQAELLRHGFNPPPWPSSRDDAGPVWSAATLIGRLLDERSELLRRLLEERDQLRVKLGCDSGATPAEMGEKARELRADAERIDLLEKMKSIEALNPNNEDWVRVIAFDKDCNHIIDAQDVLASSLREAVDVLLEKSND